MPKAPHVESEHSQGPANRQQRVRDVRGTLQICTLDWEASLKKSLEGDWSTGGHLPIRQFQLKRS